MGRGVARRCRFRLVALPVVVLPVMAGLLAEDGWMPGPAQIFDGDDGPASPADATTPAVAALGATPRCEEDRT